MALKQHSTVREGLIAGLLGAIAVAVWYFVVDTAFGRPFHTPNALGKVFFRGDLQPGVRNIIPGIVAGYTVVHVIMFVLLGTGLIGLAHLVSRNLDLRMGLWIGFVVATAFLIGITYALATATGERVPLWSVVGGSVIGVGSMAWYAWRRHPRLASAAPLGAEEESPPHAPGVPRA